jgi:hypothetical protein
MSDFMKLTSVGAGFSRAGRQNGWTDKHVNVTYHFLQYCEHA